MDILHTRCAGIDVHKKNVKVCLSITDEHGKRKKEIRTYLTMTHQLLELRDWLKEQGCSHIAEDRNGGVLETGVQRGTEGDFEILLVNAHHMKAVPGRKTDVKDAEWIADLLQHGLLKASFIPSAPQRELRDLTRYRVSLVEERAREVNRLQKTLEDTNLKLGDVVSDIMGKASSRIVHAIADGETDPVRLASFAVGRVRASKEELEAALTGKVTEHHRFMLNAHLKEISWFDTAIEQVNAEIARRLAPPEPPPEEQAEQQDNAESGEHGGDENEPEPSACVPPSSTCMAPAVVEGQPPLSWQEAVRLVDQITGISEQVAWGVLAEIGIQMSQFPSEKHLASWVGLCPGNHESAGKRYSGKTRKGNPYARRLLIQAALAAAKSKKSYLSTQYRRIAARRGKKKAAVAVAHSILVIIYHVLRDRSTYQDLGSSYFDERDRQAVQKQLVRRLERMGYQVDLQPVA